MTPSPATKKRIARQIALAATCGAMLGLVTGCAAGALTLRLLPAIAGNRTLAGLVFAGLSGLGIVLGAAWGSRRTRTHLVRSGAPPGAPKRP